MSEDTNEIRRLLIGAQAVLLTWLWKKKNEARAMALVRQCLETDRDRSVREVLTWLAESENMQAAFRHIRAHANDEFVMAPCSDAPSDSTRVRDALLTSAEKLVLWLHDPKHEEEMLRIACEVGETVNILRILARLRSDAGYMLAQSMFHTIRARMMGGRPVSLGRRDATGNDLAGLAAMASFR